MFQTAESREDMFILESSKLKLLCLAKIAVGSDVGKCSVLNYWLRGLPQFQIIMCDQRKLYKRHGFIFQIALFT